MAEQGEKPPIVSSAAIAFFGDVFRKMTGLLLVVAGLALIAALVSHSPMDPSFNTATDQVQTDNILGQLGADISSVVIAMFGFTAAFLLALIPVIWGCRLWFRRWRQRLRLRLLLLPIVAILLSTSMRSSELFFSLDQKAGGAVGEMVFNLVLDHPRLAELIIPTPPISASHLIAGTIILAAIAGYVYTAMIGSAEWKALVLLMRGLRRLTHIALVMVLKLKAIAIRQSANAGKKRKQPAPRREPVILADNTAPEEITQTPKPRKKPAENKQESLGLATPGGYILPAPELLAEPNEALVAPDATALDNTSKMLEGVLSEFGVGGSIDRASFGPVVTRYELTPAPGTKTQRVIGLADDIARSMSALSVRVAVAPGQNTIGIELPNHDRQTVLMRDILDHDDWGKASATLPLALGMDIAGKPVITDLAKMPHLLVAGTTGSGKSVGINAMILSLLYTHTPETCRLIMIDPKILELSVYDGIPHLLTPVVTDPSKAVVALKWAVREMENRYRNMAKLEVRNIDGYNKAIREARRKGKAISRRVQTGFDEETGQPVFEHETLELAVIPYIVVVIDEVADLMLVAGKDIEAAVQRLAQMARAAGIHVIMATQRPSVDVITGTIKANFPTRISFQVTSRIDSRTILGEQGAEHLLGRGDMLFMEGGGRLIRVHGPFVSDGEVERVVSFLRQQGEPVYDESVTIEANGGSGNGGFGDSGDGSGQGDSSLYDQAVELVRREGKASTSFIQRHLRIGYNRAATIIEDMERNGVVSAANHAGKREVLGGHDEGFDDQ